ncbi:MAG TPA: SH3 domain-containing protein [Anaerolineales bacterium]|nr:SH3 domain-containing protein [Anaerolineales bacterium]
MKNKRTMTLILIITAMLLAACAPGLFNVAPVFSEPEPLATSATAGAAASVTFADDDPTTDVSSNPDGQPLPEPPAAENPQPLALGQVNVQGLNLRAGPSANHVILGLLGEGTELEIQGRSENLQWLLVRVPGGTQGWVYFEYVDTQTTIASLPLKEAYGGPNPAPSNAGQDVRQPLNVQVSIENDLAILSIAGFPGDSKVIARLREVGESTDLYVDESVTTPNGNAVIRFTMPSLDGDEFNLVVSTADGDESVNVRIQYFHN